MNVLNRTRGQMAGVLCGIALAAGFAMQARADQWDKRTILTVNQPIQVTDKLLEPGRYVFKLLDSSSNRHIVQIYNGDQTHLIDTVMAIPNYRLQPTGESRFMFWETPPGNARALRAWFYPGDNFGQEFTYPKHPIVLQAAVRNTETQTQTQTQVTPPAAAPETSVSPQPAPESAAERPAPAPEQPTELAQNTPPQQPAPPAAASQPAPAERGATG